MYTCLSKDVFITFKAYKYLTCLLAEAVAQSGRCVVTVPMDKRSPVVDDALMSDHIPAEHRQEFERLKNALPAGTEMARLLKSLDNPAPDEASQDRYVALVAGNAVQGALKVALGLEADTKRPFDNLIKLAEQSGLVTAKQAVELHRIRDIRNLFAHALEPISFRNAAVSAVTKAFWDHPVTSWSGYFAPAFPDRVKFTIVCGEFFEHLLRASPSASTKAPPPRDRGGAT